MKAIARLLVGCMGLSIYGCAQAPPADNRKALLLDEKQQYWDEVFIKDYFGNVQEKFFHKEGVPQSSVLFREDGFAIHFYNKNDTVSINMNDVTGNVIINPDKYKVDNDSITITGNKYKIEFITDSVFALKSKRGTSEMLNIYVLSKFQRRQIIRI